MLPTATQCICSSSQKRNQNGSASSEDFDILLDLGAKIMQAVESVKKPRPSGQRLKPKSFYEWAMTVISRSPEDIGGVGQRSLYKQCCWKNRGASPFTLQRRRMFVANDGDIGEMSAAAARILTFAAAAPMSRRDGCPNPVSNQHRQERQRDRPTMKLWLIVSLPLYILDQTTKALVLLISRDEMLPIIPGVFNRFNVEPPRLLRMLKDNNLFFIAAACRLDQFSRVLQRRLYRLGSRWAAALLIPNVAGNLTDRIRYGYVVDFLD